MTEELFQEYPYRRSCDSVVLTADAERRCFTTNCTVFYPEGGGQPGDTGLAFYKNDDEIGIIDTRRNRESGVIEHFVEEHGPLPEPRQPLYLELDWERRYRLMRMHSCLHLLCAVIPSKVTGGQVSDGRGRLDFDVSEPLDKEQITYRLNLLVEEKADRDFIWVTSEELDANPGLVKTLSVQPPRDSESIRLISFNGIDIQPCGGTHVANTFEIGHVRVTKIENKGRRNRRVTVVFED